MKDTGRVYDIDFFGAIMQNGIEESLWSDVQRKHYIEDDKDWLLANCNFKCKIGERKISPYFNDNMDYSEVQINY